MVPIVAWGLTLYLARTDWDWVELSTLKKDYIIIKTVSFIKLVQIVYEIIDDINDFYVVLYIKSNFQEIFSFKYYLNFS